jgi:hypothetical protein
MKRWPLVLLWLAGQLIWNLITKQHVHGGGDSYVYLFLVALGQMTSPAELIATALVMMMIWSSKRKSLAERQQEKADKAESAL